MKKINTNEYAEILFELTNGKNAKEMEEVIKTFTSFLAKNKALSQIEEIEKSYIRLVDEKNSVVRGEIRTSQKLTHSQLNEISKNTEKIFNAKEVILEERIDEKLIGGWKIKTENYLIDASLRGRIDKLGLALKK